MNGCPVEHSADRALDMRAQIVGKRCAGQEMSAHSAVRDVDDHQRDQRSRSGSRPVRVGNAVWRQVQLDVMGEILEAAYVMREKPDLDAPTADFLCDLADRAGATW